MNPQDVEQLLKGQVGFILATAIFMIVGLIAVRWLLPVVKGWIAALQDNTAATKEIAQAVRDIIELVKDKNNSDLREIIAELRANHAK